MARMISGLCPPQSVAAIRSGPAHQMGVSEVRGLIPMLLLSESPLYFVRMGKISPDSCTNAKNVSFSPKRRDQRCSLYVTAASRLTHVLGRVLESQPFRSQESPQARQGVDSRILRANVGVNDRHYRSASAAFGASAEIALHGYAQNLRRYRELLLRRGDSHLFEIGASQSTRANMRDPGLD